MNLSEIIRERVAINSSIETRQKDFMAWLEQQRQRLTVLAHDESLLAAGVDAERIEHGLHVIYVHGDYSKPVTGRGYTESDRRSTLVADAKADLAHGAPKLKRGYFGVKNYSGFGDQREDHDYGLGPRHGSIVFSIGLTQAARKDELTQERIEDALYVLANLDHLNKAREQSAA